ncbi:MAG: DUF4230 domain-containing protein [Clostridiales bacterium]|nr:DUF4230 domain-containing protein [Clostridiales bacterium]
MKTNSNLKLWIVLYATSAILLVELVVLVYAIATFRLPTAKDLVLKDNSDLNVEATNTVIHRKLESIGELETYKYTYDGYITQESDRGWEYLNFLTESNIEIDYVGTIRAGIHFNEIGIDVDENKKIIYLEMPKPVILSNEVDITHYSEEVAIFGGVSGDTANTLTEAAKEDELNEAINQGLLRNADENAKKIVGDLLSAFDEYEIVYIDRDQEWR